MSIKIDLKIFLFLFLFLITSQLEIYILLMIFAILHELGHLVAGLLLKFRPEEIKLTPVGLQIQFKTNSEYKDSDKMEIKSKDLVDKRAENYSINNIYIDKLSNKSFDITKTIKYEFNIKRAIIVLAGPLTNFLIIMIWIIIGTFNVSFKMTYLYQIIIYSNFLIGIFNLIPIYPLDGGRFINELLKIILGNKKAYKYTYIISKTTLIILTAASSIAILYLKKIAVVIILGYLWYLEIIEIRRYNKRKNIERIIKQVEENQIAVKQ